MNGFKIPAVTVYQPWATLTAKGLKKIETRTSARQWASATGKPLATPIPARGYQGLWGWEPPEEIVESLAHTEIFGELTLRGA